MSRNSPWLEILRRRIVWRRALLLSAPVAALQVAINQGDHWLHGAVTAGVVAKTIATPLVTLGVALASAAATERAAGRDQRPSSDAAHDSC